MILSALKFIWEYFLYVIDSISWAISSMNGGEVPAKHNGQISHAIVFGVIFLALTAIVYFTNLDREGYPKRKRPILIAVLAGLIPGLIYFLIAYIFSLI
ncbi:MAG: hypothetical protein IKV79_02480 [Oscillospiraceae bacterium]|nr:hypothetical protein [Oscillospiraceae bacterium]